MRVKFAALGMVMLWPLALSQAQSDGPLPPDLQVWSDVRLAYSSTGKEWLDGGSNKTRYGASEASGFDAELADFSVLWTPTLSAALSAHLHLQAGPDQAVDLGLVEGFVRYRPLPKAGWRLSAKAGRFFPPVSFEHDGPGWGLTRTLTPSALNSWIGEEVAVVGTEARAAKRFGDHQIDLRAAVFGYNDTAGALIAYRGWAMHDIKSALHGKFSVPDRVALEPALSRQARVTETARELDDQLGFYTALRWRYADQSTWALTLYDNLADSEVFQNGQYGWRTQFVSLGGHHQATESIELIAQGLVGRTVMGPRIWPNGTHTTESEFATAYLLGTWHVSDSTLLSGRVDSFRVEDLTGWQSWTDEQGWSVTTAWRHKPKAHLEIGAELLYLEHDRDLTRTTGDQPSGVQVQWMLKTAF